METGDRLSYATTMILSIVAFQFITSNILPNVPYLTLVDKYIILTLLCIVGITLESVFLGFYQLSFSEDEIETIDQYTFFIIAGVDIVAHLWFLYVAIKSNNFENRKIGKSKKELATMMYENNQASSDETVSIMKFMRHDFESNPQKYTDYDL